MLDQLVESKSNSAEVSRRTGFLATVFVIMATLLISGVIYSLFAKDYGMGSDGLELSSLVAPIPVEDEPPPKPEVQEQKKAPNVDTRTQIIQSMEESPKPPDKISSEKQNIPPRDPNKYTVIGDKNVSVANAPPSNYRGPVSTDGSGSDDSSGVPPAPPPDAPPPPPPAAKPSPPPPSKPISGGVLNGKATRLPAPAYPPAARAVRAGGSVAVQVVIDENGNVTSASAVSGHPLLRAVAAQAARGAKFKPTLLSGQAVKVSALLPQGIDRDLCYRSHSPGRNFR